MTLGLGEPIQFTFDKMCVIFYSDNRFNFERKKTSSDEKVAFDDASY